MHALATAIVALAGCFLVGLAVAMVVARHRAERFLQGFASSLRVHLTEQLLRIVVGASLIAVHDAMRWPEAWWVFGWILVVTSAVLAVIPWRWHHRFGELVIPLAIRFLPVYGAGSLALGVLVLYALAAP